MRTVPIPDWVKSAIDEWKEASGITEGPIFRSINKMGQVWGNGMSAKVLWQIVRDAAGKVDGWYVYYAKRGGVSQVLQLGAREATAGRVLDRLVVHRGSGGTPKGRE